MDECEYLSTCGFFKKWGQTKELACRGLIRLYCKGSRHNACKRKKYRVEHGIPPPDDMLPNGYMCIGGKPERVQQLH